MSLLRLSRSLVPAAILALSSFAVSAEEIPLTNWQVPGVSNSGPRGISNNTHLPASGFVAITPCRIVDTRTAAGPFGGPFMTAGSTRSFDLNTGSPCSGDLPSTNIRAYSLNVTVTGTSVNGHLSIGPTGSNPAGSFSTLNYPAGATIANAAIVPPDGNGSIDVFAVAQLHLIIDINGYFPGTMYPTNQFNVEANYSGAAAILGVNISGGSGSHAVGGFASGAGLVHGVQGQISSSATGAEAGGSSGVHGIGAGVAATSGVLGEQSGLSFSGTPGFFASNVGVTARAQRGILSFGTEYGVVGANVNAGGTGNDTIGYLGFSDTTGLFVSGNGSISGNLSVSGTVSKGGGSFKIDHPLDPENKYLYHSFVESPDMMNIYNGVIVLDADGSAFVQMPEWFETLNRDFRYQLTSIGRPQPNLYIADEIDGNMFRIAGGKPGAKVSWTVTGVRQDAFANRYRIPVEEEKPEMERGLYLHPEAFDKPLTKSVVAAGANEEIRLHLEQKEQARQQAAQDNNN
jgi:hypothetical protein